MYEISLQLPFYNLQVGGTLSLPVKAKSIIIFAHFKNSNIRIPKQKELAFQLQENGFGTLTFNLIGQRDFLIEPIAKQVNLFSRGLFNSINCLNNHSEYRSLDFALLGAGLGSDILFKSTAMQELTVIKSIVSFSGYFDFVKEGELINITCPTLLTTGELDFPNVKKNKQIKNMLNSPTDLSLIDGAHNLSGKNCPINKISQITSEWLKDHLALNLQSAAF